MRSDTLFTREVTILIAEEQKFSSSQQVGEIEGELMETLKLKSRTQHSEQNSAKTIKKGGE